jgi:hypothetical protein
LTVGNLAVDTKTIHSNNCRHRGYSRKDWHYSRQKVPVNDGGRGQGSSNASVLTMEMLKRTI